MLRNRIFAADGEIHGFLPKMDNLVPGENRCVLARILSSKFGLLDPMTPLTCSNTSLVDSTIKDYSEHGLWTMELNPVPCVSLPAEPSLAVNLCDALPWNPTIGKCGRPCMCNFAPGLQSKPTMLSFPALNGQD